MGFELAPRPLWTKSCNKSEAPPTAVKDSAVIIIPFFSLDCAHFVGLYRYLYKTSSWDCKGIKIMTFNKNLSCSRNSKFRESIRGIVYEINGKCFNWLGILTYALSCALSLRNARVYYILTSKRNASVTFGTPYCINSRFILFKEFLFKEFMIS